ncbi:hypothetical protein HMPREF0724_10198 [Prescottella equi ATCC 33707]|uniref:Uncharacterized protein n=1 Tax=Prescottella equi ATCC 33707 TaxID=525370 RepID=E9SVD0_RHOHA|nr:hypothetical protein HMPREF0724_10198 [Prescottella equi ATCC 33707]
MQRPSEHPGAGFPFGRASRAVLCTRHSWPILGPPPAAIHHRTALARSNYIRTECAVRCRSRTRARPPTRRTVGGRVLPYSSVSSPGPSGTCDRPRSPPPAR